MQYAIWGRPNKFMPIMLLRVVPSLEYAVECIKVMCISCADIQIAPAVPNDQSQHQR